MNSIQIANALLLFRERNNCISCNSCGYGRMTVVGFISFTTKFKLLTRTNTRANKIISVKECTWK